MAEPFRHPVGATVYVHSSLTPWKVAKDDGLGQVVIQRPGDGRIITRVVTRKKLRTQP